MEPVRSRLALPVAKGASGGATLTVAEWNEILSAASYLEDKEVSWRVLSDLGHQN